MKQKVIPNITAKKRINEIDLLRFFAVIAVVFFHYAFRGYTADKMSVMPYPLAPIAKYGYFGVHLFFMISGFVILMTASSGNLRRFIVSRVARLYPAFWVCCTITFAITMLIGAPRYTASVSQYLINMTMLSGFVSVKSIDGVYWSLFVELRFYALVGLIMLIGKINKAQLFLAVWLVICITLDVLNITKMRYLLIVDYAAFFIAGATFFLIWSKGLSPQRIAMIFGSLGLAL
jgi:peptidoglycan/LPS O-acetylase OafA/YrhL